jgi:hypothetical protein
MASLHPPPAIVAPAHSDIETAHDGSPDNLFLILCFAALRLYTPTAMQAVRWQCNRDPFIYARRDGTACLSAVAAARFAARPLWGSFWCAARMRSGLPLAGAQRCFQFPAQAFSFLFQALDLFAQPLVFLLRSIELLFRNKFNALRWLVCGEPTNGFHPTLRYAKPHLLSSKIFERPISEHIRLVNKYYFFWSGEGTPHSRTNKWGTRLRKAYTTAVKGGATDKDAKKAAHEAGTKAAEKAGYAGSLPTPTYK